MTQSQTSQMTSEEYEDWYNKNLQRLVLNIHHDCEYDRTWNCDFPEGDDPHTKMEKEIHNLIHHLAQDPESWVRFQNLVNTIAKPAKQPKGAIQLPL